MSSFVRPPPARSLCEAIFTVGLQRPTNLLKLRKASGAVRRFDLCGVCDQTSEVILETEYCRKFPMSGVCYRAYVVVQAEEQMLFKSCSEFA